MSIFKLIAQVPRIWVDVLCFWRWPRCPPQDPLNRICKWFNVLVIGFFLLLVWFLASGQVWQDGGVWLSGVYVFLILHFVSSPVRRPETFLGHTLRARLLMNLEKKDAPKIGRMLVKAHPTQFQPHFRWLLDCYPQQAYQVIKETTPDNRATLQREDVQAMVSSEYSELRKEGLRLLKNIEGDEE